MPWPYLSARNKGRSSIPLTADDDSLNTGAASLSLEEAPNSSSNSTERRAASLDINRPAVQSLAPLTPSTNDKPKARRSSFPRLALPSWRQSPSPLTPSSSTQTREGGTTTALSKSNSIRSSKRQSLALEEEDDEAVELQEGYGTPYTATGLKGGFQCISPQPSTLSGSSSIASTSSSSRRSAGGSSNLFSLFSSGSGASRTSDEYSLDTQPSSVNSQSSSSMLENEARVKLDPIIGFTASSKSVPDSGFAEFGPHTIVEEEERKKALARVSDLEEQQRIPISRYRYQSSDDEDEGEQSPTSRDGDSNVTIPKKARSKGWFSFNSNSNTKTDVGPSSGGKGSNNAEDNNCCTPKNERNTPSISTATASIAESNSTSSTIDGNQANQSQPAVPVSVTGISTPKKIKQSASSKGMNMIRSAGRKRGDSEVSMKDMTTASLRE